VNQYSVSVVSQDLLTGAPWSLSCDYTGNFYNGGIDEGYEAECNGEYNIFISGLLDRVQKNTSSFQRLDNSACIKEYATAFEIGRGDAILVSMVHNSNNSLLYTQSPERYRPFGGSSIGALYTDHFNWICNVSYNAWVMDGGNPCTLQSAQGYSSNWTVNHFPVEYCLSKVVDDPCQLQFNIFILLVVAICNLLKALVMTWMVLRYNTSGLVTLGDAMASFLDNPDLTTAGICMMSSRKIRRGEWKSVRPQLYSGTRKRWWRAVSRTEWWTSQFM
jgi:hypothetical protein